MQVDYIRRTGHWLIGVLLLKKKTKYPNDRTLTLQHPSFKALKKYTELNKVRIIFKLPTINEESDL